MVKSDSEILKTLLTSAIKPIELKLHEICDKLIKFNTKFNTEVHQIKSALCVLTAEGSKKLVIDHKLPNSTASASSTPESKRGTTPARHPARTQPPPNIPKKQQRATAMRAKEKLKMQLTKRPLRGQPKDRPVDDPKEKMTVNKKSVTNVINLIDISKNDSISSISTSSCTLNESMTKEHDASFSSVGNETLKPITHHNEWKTVQRKRKHIKNPTVIKGSAKNTQIEGIQTYKFLHGCYFKTETTPDSIISHLKSIRDGNNYIVEQIPAKRATYNSYKIGIPTAVYEEFLETSA
ncbi:hypothetical protein O0L34_g18612 [Tuta absoluta]|nr:hypothetical protein O0L34_g18612 [Tuta absoluta]